MACADAMVTAIGTAGGGAEGFKRAVRRTMESAGLCDRVTFRAGLRCWNEDNESVACSVAPQVRSINHHSAWLLTAAECLIRDTNGSLGIEGRRLGVAIGLQPLDVLTTDVRRCIQAADRDPKGPIDSIVKRLQRLPPLHRLQVLPNLPACSLSIYCGAQGPCLSLMGGSAAALLAVLESANLVREGRVDGVVCGGVTVRDGELRFSQPEPIANDGAILFLVESDASMKRNGRTPYARIGGGDAGSRCDDVRRHDVPSARLTITNVCNGGEGCSYECVGQHLHLGDTTRPVSVDGAFMIAVGCRVLQCADSTGLAHASDRSSTERSAFPSPLSPISVLLRAVDEHCSSAVALWLNTDE